MEATSHQDTTETIPAKLVQLVHEDIDELVLRLLINPCAVLQRLDNLAGGTTCPATFARGGTGFCQRLA
jgi:hypothetical protein